MDIPILHTRAEIRQQHLHLLDIPLQHARQQRQRPPLATLQTLELPVAAQLLEHGVLGPRAHHQLKAGLLHGLEARVDHDVALVLADGRGLAHDLAALAEQPPPLAQGVLGVGRDGAVVALETDGGVADFQVAAGFEAGEALFHEGCPVWDGAEEVADVDVVEGVGAEGPGVVGCVVDLEFHIWGDPAWLGRGKVCADDKGFRMLVCEVDSPYAWIGAN